MKDKKYISLDADRLGGKSEALRSHLSNHIIGQQEASDAIVGAFAPFFSGLSDPNKPIAALLFLGQTGVGKTLAEEIARHVLGSVDGLTRIACENYIERHTIFNLIGSPKSYVGYGDAPRFSQSELNRWRLKQVSMDTTSAPLASVQPAVILFDEIDKASPALYQILLGILETGRLTLSDGNVTDFSKSIVVMTANWGGREISKINSGDVLGFSAGAARPDVNNVAISESNKQLSPELQNRIDRVIVFKSLTRPSLDAICELELGKVQKRIRDGVVGFLFYVTERAKRALVDLGTSTKHGARELRRVIDHEVTQKLANLIESQQIEQGNVLRIDYVRGKFKFMLKEVVVPWGELSPAPQVKLSTNEDEPLFLGI